MKSLGGNFMFGKLLKKDLSRNMRWLWILFVATLGIAVLGRGCKELGENIMLFKILGIFFDSVYYALLVNVVLQPFLRNFLNFSKSLYGDESYLTHTLPVTKNQIINAKFVTAVIEMTLGFVVMVASLLIMFVTPTFFDELAFLLSFVITGQFSITWLLILFVLLVVAEFLMFLSIIFFAIVVAYRAKEKRVLKTFLLTAGMAFASIIVLFLIILVVLTLNGVQLTSATLVLSNTALFSVLITGIVVYLVISVVFYYLAKKFFKQGVNVD